jgi:hypothetical protein
LTWRSSAKSAGDFREQAPGQGQASDAGAETFGGAGDQDARRRPGAEFFGEPAWLGPHSAFEQFSVLGQDAL